MIKVSIWYPRNTPLDTNPVSWLLSNEGYRWGHAGMKFRDVPGRENRYFAFWPNSAATDLSVPVRGEIRTSRASDSHDEGSRPDRIIEMPSGLDEVAAYDYWAQLERSSPIYSWNALNCCQAVADSIRAGFGAGSLSPLPSTMTTFLIVALRSATPYSLESWLNGTVRRALNPALARPHEPRFRI